MPTGQIGTPTAISHRTARNGSTSSGVSSFAVSTCRDRLGLCAHLSLTAWSRSWRSLSERPAAPSSAASMISRSEPATWTRPRLRRPWTRPRLHRPWTRPSTRRDQQQTPWPTPRRRRAGRRRERRVVQRGRGLRRRKRRRPAGGCRRRRSRARRRERRRLPALHTRERARPDLRRLRAARYVRHRAGGKGMRSGRRRNVRREFDGLLWWRHARVHAARQRSLRVLELLGVNGRARCHHSRWILWRTQRVPHGKRHPVAMTGTF